MSRRDQWRPITGLARIWRGAYDVGHGGHTWLVDVDFFDLSETIRLYRDGELVDSARERASFTLPGDARIEAAVALYGMAHVRLVAEGRRETLTPVEGTAERWRADLDRRHPTASRAVGFLALAMIVFGAVTQVPVVANIVLEVAAGFGLDLTWRAPTLDLGRGVNALIAVLAIGAALERGLSMRHVRGLDE